MRVFTTLIPAQREQSREGKLHRILITRSSLERTENIYFELLPGKGAARQTKPTDREIFVGEIATYCLDNGILNNLFSALVNQTPHPSLSSWLKSGSVDMSVNHPRGPSRNIYLDGYSLFAANRTGNDSGIADYHLQY